MTDKDDFRTIEQFNKELYADKDSTLRQEILETRLVTDDCYVDGLREKAIPLWETKYTHEKNELRIACDEQRKLTMEETISLIKERIKGTLLTDEELVRTTECESPEYLENEGADCPYCSNHCRKLAQAQLNAVMEEINDS